MSAEMVERVKQAIAIKCAPAIDARAPYAKIMFAEAARAAIAALREPTEAMQAAGATEHVEVAHTANREGRCLTPSHVWRAMIDAALADDAP